MTPEHAGRDCPKCSLGRVVELNLVEYHYSYDADSEEWDDCSGVSNSEPLPLWWECDHCLARWSGDVEGTRHALSSLQGLQEELLHLLERGEPEESASAGLTHPQEVGAKSKGG